MSFNITPLSSSKFDEVVNDLLKFGQKDHVAIEIIESSVGAYPKTISLERKQYNINSLFRNKFDDNQEMFLLKFFKAHVNLLVPNPKCMDVLKVFIGVYSKPEIDLKFKKFEKKVSGLKLTYDTKQIEIEKVKGYYNSKVIKLLESFDVYAKSKQDELDVRMKLEKERAIDTVIKDNEKRISEAQARRAERQLKLDNQLKDIDNRNEKKIQEYRIELDSKLEDEYEEKFQKYQIDNLHLAISIPFVNNLGKLLRDEPNGDVDLICQDGIVRVHKPLLTLYSQIYSSKFSLNLQETRFLLDLKQYPQNVVNSLMDVLYQKEVSPQLNDFESIIYYCILSAKFSIPEGVSKASETRDQFAFVDLKDTIMSIELFMDYLKVDLFQKQEINEKNIEDTFHCLFNHFENNIVIQHRRNLIDPAVAKSFLEKLLNFELKYNITAALYFSLGLQNPYRLLSSIQVMIGLCHYYGFGCGIDKDKGFEMICNIKENDRYVAYWKGYLISIDNTFGPKLDYVYLNKKAGLLGHPKANYFDCLYHNQSNIDLESTFISFSIGASKNDPAAQVALGQCYLEGNGCEKNPDKGFELFQEAAKQKFPAGLYFSGKYIIDRASEGNLKFSLQLQNNEINESQHAISKLHYSKKILKGLEYIEEAGECDDTNAMFFLGQCYEKGIGYKIDIKAAVGMYIKAYKLGNKEAKDALKRLRRIYEY